MILRDFQIAMIFAAAIVLTGCDYDETDGDGDVDGDADGDVDGDGDGDGDADVDADADVEVDGPDPVDCDCGKGPYCLIGGLCFPARTVNPDNACQVCNPALDASGWSDYDGARCDDALFCTVDDTCDAGMCSGVARDCSDGVACNGEETCSEADAACDSGESQCQESELCDFISDQCVATCVGCSIERVCYGSGSLNPANYCEICNVSASTNAWTSNSGASCDDLSECTSDDVCVEGECRGTSEACDDGVACDGVETCSPDGMSCLVGISPCEAHEVCDVVADGCVAICGGCVIDDLCYGDGLQNPENPCLRCDVEQSVTSWSVNDGVACDDGSFCTGDDICSGGACSIHAGDPCAADGDLCWDDGERCCLSDAYVACSGESVVTYDSCDRPIAEDDCTLSGRVCWEASCVCPPGWSGEDCDRCVFFVDSSLPDYTDHDGSSWSSALETIQEGINAAVDGGCDVWVAGLFHRPTENVDGVLTDGRDATFHMAPGVGLYGGFFGTELILAERDIDGNAVILDGSQGDTGVFHVVTGAEGGVLDGFIVQGGRADGDGDGESNGAGMYNRSASVSVRNCTFRNNTSTDMGGGIFNHESAEVIITNCSFEGFTEGYYGGAIGNDTVDSLEIERCRFEGYDVVTSVLATLAVSEITLTDTDFINNYADPVANLVQTDAVTLTRGSFVGNEGYGVLAVTEGTLDVSGTVFESNESTRIITPGLVTTTLSDCVFAGNSGGFAINSGTIDNCTFESNGGSFLFGFGLGYGEVTNSMFRANDFGLNETVLSITEGDVINSVFEDNIGQALVVTNGSVQGCLFQDNSLGMEMIEGSVRDCVFERNMYGGLDIGRGVVSSCTFTDNTATQGAGARSGEALVVGCTFTNNHAVSSGGGMTNYGMTIGCTFDSNSAGIGGGMVGGRVINSVFENNTAIAGGAVHMDRGEAELINCTLASNSATELGGGILLETNLTVANTIFWDNTAPIGPDYFGDDSTITFSHAAASEALFGLGNVELTSSPFAAGSLELHRDSTCIDAGNDSLALFADIEGRGRVDIPLVAGSLSDIGAHEYQGISCSPIDTYDGHLYWASCQPLDHAAASEYCGDFGGHLVTISDDNENQFVQSLIDDDVWIGAYRSAPLWEWETGEPWAYTSWDTIFGEPDDTGSCAFMSFRGAWYDEDCAQDHLYVCELDE